MFYVFLPTRSEFARLNFQGFYTVVLEKDDVLISVASIRQSDNYQEIYLQLMSYFSESRHLFLLFVFSPITFCNYVSKSNTMLIRFSSKLLYTRNILYGALPLIIYFYLVEFLLINNCLFFPLFQSLVSFCFDFLSHFLYFSMKFLLKNYAT